MSANTNFAPTSQNPEVPQPTLSPTPTASPQYLESTAYDAAGSPFITWIQQSITSEGGSVSGPTVTSDTAVTSSATSSSSVVPSINSQENSNQSTSLPSAAAIPAASSGGVAPGAVAGIAIATAILGAAIALIAAFFVFRRRRNIQQAYEDSRVSTPELIASLKGGGGGGGNKSYLSLSQSIATPPVVASAFSPPAETKRSVNLTNLAHSSNFLADVLPAPADEATVRNRCAILFNQILHHIETYYRDVQATMTPSMEKDLKRFGSDSLDMAEMLRDTSMPTIAIKHALSGYITSIVLPGDGQQATLFPSEISGHKNDQVQSTHEDQAAYIIYKRLAVHLYSPDIATLTSQQSDIREAAEHFALTFFPWANPAFQDQEKDEDLASIMINALEISVWLYSQPYTYEFIWEDLGFRGIAIAPGLMRTTDVSGRRMDHPEVLLEPLVVASR